MPLLPGVAFCLRKDSAAFSSSNVKAQLIPVVLSSGDSGGESGSGSSTGLMD